MTVFETRDFHIEEATVSTIGKFDGRHLGHQKLLGKMRFVAAQMGLRIAVFTFQTSPTRVVQEEQKAGSAYGADGRDVDGPVGAVGLGEDAGSKAAVRGMASVGKAWTGGEAAVGAAEGREMASMGKTWTGGEAAGKGALSTREERREIMGESGVDYLVEYPFTPEIAHIDAEAFVREILVGRMNAKALVVGSDCAFGYQRGGNVDLLRKFAQELGYRLFVIEKERDGGRDISSTYVKECLSAGDMENAARLLGRPFGVKGVAERATDRGMAGGCAGDNHWAFALRIPDGKQLPPLGQYASVTKTADGRCLDGVSTLYAGRLMETLLTRSGANPGSGRADGTWAGGCPGGGAKPGSGVADGTRAGGCLDGGADAGVAEGQAVEVSLLRRIAFYDDGAQPADGPPGRAHPGGGVNCNEFLQ
ncbi:MAG: FAD synthetase family protein [Lachnospiraceae bacterium]|jgi:FAD synthase|nr:FAD synthetase family protein [Lachnospiraceae bacterium]